MTVTDPVLSQVSRLCLGGNVFGWTMDEAESFTVLDAYLAGGGNFIDTADAYSVWVEGHAGGDSEEIIGSWLASRHNRDQVILATKFGQLLGVSAGNVRASVEGSLRRLRTDYIDLYYAHIDDAAVPLEETLGALSDLVAEGKVRAIGASGYSAGRLAEALAVSEDKGFPRYVAMQPLYNLMERDDYEGALQDLCVREGIACLPFFSLARGFLTGKYRPGVTAETKRGGFAWTGEWDERSRAVLAALDAVAATHGTTVAAAALTWLSAQPGVLAPIASARTPEQLRDLMPALTLDLTAGEVRQLTEASGTPS
jgi:aryl-alcohol dehydrogenase-like predicted oxidoreductase